MKSPVDPPNKVGKQLLVTNKRRGVWDIDVPVQSIQAVMGESPASTPHSKPAHRDHNDEHHGAIGAHCGPTQRAASSDASAAHIAAQRPAGPNRSERQVYLRHGAGIGLLVEIDRQVRGRGGQVRFEHMQAEQQRVLNLALLKNPAATLAPPPSGDNLVIKAGKSTASVLSEIGAIIAFTGELTVVLLWAMTHPHRVRWGDALLAAEKTGSNAVPVVCLLGFLVGLIIAFQTAGPMKTFGAESLVPTVVAIAIISELGPLMAAIILAGRSGSAFAAEIGTMKVTEEINALRTFGLSPTKFLVVPRVLASLAVTPLLGVFSSLMGVLGGYVVMASLGYSLSFYVDQVIDAVDYIDFLEGVFKSFVFAMLVAGIGCLNGLRTQSGPGAVGDSTTKAVVAGIVLIVLADAVMGMCFYYINLRI